MLYFASRFGVMQQVKMLLQWNIVVDTEVYLQIYQTYSFTINTS